jgi:hypothetical protein
VANLVGPAFQGGAYGLSALGGARAPDIIGVLIVDQAWGVFQLSAAAHNNHAAYYGITEDVLQLSVCTVNRSAPVRIEVVVERDAGKTVICAALAGTPVTAGVTTCNPSTWPRSAALSAGPR